MVCGLAFIGLTPDNVRLRGAEYCTIEYVQYAMATWLARKCEKFAIYRIFLESHNRHREYFEMSARRSARGGLERVKHGGRSAGSDRRGLRLGARRRAAASGRVERGARAHSRVRRRLPAAVLHEVLALRHERALEDNVPLLRTPATSFRLVYQRWPVLNFESLLTSCWSERMSRHGRMNGAPYSVAIPLPQTRTSSRVSFRTHGTPRRAPGDCLREWRDSVWSNNEWTLMSIATLQVKRCTGEHYTVLHFRVVEVLHVVEEISPTSCTSETHTKQLTPIGQRRVAFRTTEDASASRMRHKKPAH